MRRKSEPLIRRLEGISDQLYREMIRLEKLEDRLGDLGDGVNKISVPLDQHYSARSASLDAAARKIERAKWVLSGLEEPLQEVVATIADAQDFLGDLDAPRPRR